MGLSRLAPLIVACSVASPAVASAAGPAPQPQAVRVSVDVPYLSQTEALCGGAAAAMVFRYWGDTHARPEQFAAIVDRRAGGIANGALVGAIVQRGWRAAPVLGSIEMLREHIERQRPVIILVEVGRARFHYLVVTGVGADAVIVHDPSRGPSRRLAIADLMRAWQGTNFWALVVLPADAPSAPPALAPRSLPNPGACEVLLDEAIGRVRREGFGSADDAFGDVRARCPESAGAFRELAGVRFAERRWRDAEDLADQAVARDPRDAYAWDVLASSRFVLNDFSGALRAWNRIGRPRVDSVAITGLAHARYEAIVAALGLAPVALLTPEAFARISRRLRELPDQTNVRVGYRPAGDGFAVIDVAVAERAARPRGPIEWSAAAARTLANREIDVSVPGVTGQGELWTMGWRWWSGRPRALVAFTTPHAGRLPGIWRVEGSWESQRYGRDEGASPIVTETRGHGGLTVSDWLTGTVRYGVSAGMDTWNGERRTVSLGGALDWRFLEDRVSVATTAVAFLPVSAHGSFQTASVRADGATSTATAGWTLSVSAGAAAVTAAAPLALWPGAGEGQARPALLRAHPLLDGGAIVGPAFGRVLLNAGSELRWWARGPSPIHAGVAVFIDAAPTASPRPLAAAGPWQVDAGVGLRVKVPGVGGALRADVGRGLLDGAMAFTMGWGS